MKLTAHAKIFTQDGHNLGTLKRVVIDPRNDQVTHLVFEHGALSANKEYVLPAQHIAAVDAQGIHLNELPVEEKQGLTPFKDEEYILTDEAALTDEDYISAEALRSYYAYPPIRFGAAGLANPNPLYPDRLNPAPPASAPPAIPGSGEPPIIRGEEENIPAGTVALKEGARVSSKDEKQVGSVEKVIVNPDNLRISHLVIAKGLLLKAHKLVPVDWVDDYTEDQVYLAVNADLVRRLPDYGGE